MATGLTLSVVSAHREKKTSPPSPTPQVSGSSGEEDEDGRSCGALRLSSLASLFRRAGQTLHVTGSQSRSKTPSPTSPPETAAQSSSDNLSSSVTKNFRGKNDRLLSSPERTDGKVRNIYRQPASRIPGEGGRPRASSYDARTLLSTLSPQQRAYRTRHASFSVTQSTSAAQRPGRARVSSPVHEEDDVTGLEVRRQTTDVCTNPSQSPVLPPGGPARLGLPACRPRASSMPAIPPSILRRRRQPDSAPKPACRFRPEVDVIYFERPDGPLDNWDRASPELPSQELTSRELKSRELPSGELTSRELKSRELPSRDITPRSGKHRQSDTVTMDTDRQYSPVSGGSFDCDVSTQIMPTIDALGTRGRRLRVTVAARGSYVRDLTSVKSLSGGGALIVTLYDKHNGSMRSYSRKIPLPVTVDPYHVKAHVHKDGVLTIDAPVAEVEISI